MPLGCARAPWRNLDRPLQPDRGTRVMRILMVEDEREMARLVAGNLSRNGLLVDHAANCATARDMLASARYALVLLDRGLPDGDGLSLLPAIRRTQPGAPVLALTALDQLDEKVQGLDAGADDYLTKPFFTDELMARIRAALRRPGAEPPEKLVCARLSFDPQTREIQVSGAPLALKRRELLVLEALMRRTGRVVQRHALLDAALPAIHALPEARRTRWSHCTAPTSCRSRSSV